MVKKNLYFLKLNILERYSIAKGNVTDEHLLQKERNLTEQLGKEIVELKSDNLSHLETIQELSKQIEVRNAYYGIFSLKSKWIFICILKNTVEKLYLNWNTH